jgi:hypothetical protein
MRSLVVWLAALSACGTSPDPRDPTVEVIALQILAPSCGQVQCHSTTSKIQGLAFDTLDEAKAALRKLTGTEGSEGSELMDVLTDSGSSRMPPDAPLQDADIELVRVWLDNGAPGL